MIGNSPKDSRASPGRKRFEVVVGKPVGVRVPLFGTIEIAKGNLE